MHVKFEVPVKLRRSFNVLYGHLGSMYRVTSWKDALGLINMKSNRVTFETLFCVQ